MEYEYNESKEYTLKEAKRILKNKIYKTSLFIEHMENLGLWQGNGHTVAQHIAEFAANKLEERWKGKEVDN